MKSALPKVLHRVAGLTLVERVLRTAGRLAPASTTVIVGSQAEAVRAAIGQRAGLSCVVQETQLGTGHALLQAEPALRGQAGTVLLLSGDVPLLTSTALAALLQAHAEEGAVATVLTAVVPRPYGYGRVVRSRGQIVRIVEEKDASPAVREIREINAGIYAFDLAALFDTLRKVGAANAQGEYYLPDLVALYRRARRRVATWTVPNADEVRGVNSRTELAEVSGMVRQQKNEEVMASGVTLEDPATTYIDADVTIGADTVVHPCVHLEGSTRIGAACEIHAGARIVNSVIGDRVTVLNYSVIVDSTVESDSRVGPFAHLRQGAALGERVRLGNFVEVKKTTLGDGAKAPHLAYLGDTSIGPAANVGAGTITCNFDGEKKSPTVIGAGAFIGSNATLVAPVTIGEGAYVAAGSVITDAVPPDALAIGRARQENKEGWARKKRQVRSEK
jgi:bifunctional UDP-N-acetylglucosamine pyrophosphorylase/glucosamine-1-phosphate N-acetyltransferase